MDDRQFLIDATEENPSRTAQYHQLMLDLSLSFINLPVERMGEATRQALARMGAFLAADRAYVFEYDFDTQTASNTVGWCAHVVEPAIDQLHIPVDGMPEWLQAHRRGEPLLVPDVGRLPPGRLREVLETLGISSLLTAPLMNEQTCIGFVSFDSVRRERQLSEAEYEMLVLFANLLVSIEQRRRTVDELSRTRDSLALVNQRFMNILDGTYAAVYVADMDTHEVLFVNRYARGLVGDVVGKTCWRSIQGRTDGPCAFCTNPRLLKSDGSPAAPVTYEHYNRTLGRWFHITDQAIPWDDGRYVRVEVALDVTDRKAAEQGLQESEQRYRRLFDNSRDALMIVEPPTGAL